MVAGAAPSGRDDVAGDVPELGCVDEIAGQQRPARATGSV
jgi:hypothetical protein